MCSSGISIITKSVPLTASETSSTFMPAFFCLVPGGAALSQADRDFHSRVVQVQGVGVSLRPVTHDRDLLALDERQVRVLVVIDFHAVSFWFCGERVQTFKTLSPRPMPEAPVRTVSRMALCSSA